MTLLPIILLYLALAVLAMVLVYRGAVFGGLILTAVMAASATFVLDTFQQEINYPDKKVIVLAAMWASGENKQKYLDECVADFERDHPEYKVIIRYDGRWVLSKNRPRLLTGKDIPDIIEGGKEELRILVAENFALPLDGIMDRPSIQTGRPWREDWLPPMLEMGRYRMPPPMGSPDQRYALDGKLTQVPSICTNMLWFYNKALMRKLGATLPRTWDEFFALCQKARDAGIDPIVLDKEYQDMLVGALTRINLPDDAMIETLRGTGKPFTDPQYLRIWQVERTMVDKYLMAGWMASHFPKAQQEFATGRGLMVFCGSWLPGELREVAVKDKSVFELGVMPMMRFDDEPPGTFAMGSSGWMILKDGPQNEGAVKLLQYLTDRLGRQIALNDGNQVTFARDPLPPELAEIADQIKNMQRVVTDGIGMHAPKWERYVFLPLHKQFMESEPGSGEFLTAEQFGAELQKKTEQYRRDGGEARWK